MASHHFLEYPLADLAFSLDDTSPHPPHTRRAGHSFLDDDCARALGPGLPVGFLAPAGRVREPYAKLRDIPADAARGDANRPGRLAGRNECVEAGARDRHDAVGRNNLAKANEAFRGKRHGGLRCGFHGQTLPPLSPRHQRSPIRERSDRQRLLRLARRGRKRLKSAHNRSQLQPRIYGAEDAPNELRTKACELDIALSTSGSLKIFEVGFL